VRCRADEGYPRGQLGVERSSTPRAAGPRKARSMLRSYGASGVLRRTGRFLRRRKGWSSAGPVFGNEARTARKRMRGASGYGRLIAKGAALRAGRGSLWSRDAFTAEEGAISDCR
jgi:hypothetical protein